MKKYIIGTIAVVGTLAIGSLLTQWTSAGLEKEFTDKYNQTHTSGYHQIIQINKNYQRQEALIIVGQFTDKASYQAGYPAIKEYRFHVRKEEQPEVREDEDDPESPIVQEMIPAFSVVFNENVLDNEGVTEKTRIIANLKTRAVFSDAVDDEEN